MKLRLLFFLFISVQLFGQNIYKAEYLQFTDGLPSDAVFMTVKKDGFLYAATQKGLSMYDGYIFVNSKELPNSIWNLTQKRGRLLGEESGTGLFEVKDIYGKKKLIAKVNYTDASADNDHFNNVYEDDLGNVWCSDFHFLKYYNLKSKKHKVYRITNDNKQLDIKINYLENDKELIIATTKGLFVWNKNREVLYKKSPIHFTSAINSGGKNFLFSETGQFYEYQSQTGKLVFKSLLYIHQPVFAVKDFRQNNILMLYDSEKIYHYNLNLNQLNEVFNSEDRINHVLFDKQANIFWVSTQKGIVKLIRNKGIINTVLLPENSNTPVTDVLHFNGEMFAVKNGKFLFRNKDSQWTNVAGDFNKVNRLKISAGKLLVSVNNGVLELDEKGNFKKIINTDFPVKNAVYFQGKYWVIPESDRIRVYDGATLQEVPKYLKNDGKFWRINYFNDFEISDNKLWLASWMPQDYGISYFNPDTQSFEQIGKIKENEKKFVADYFNRAKKLKNGNVIFSSTGGFNIVNSNGEIVYVMNTRAKNIASDNIFGIDEDQEGNIWFGCAEGLYQFNLKTGTAVRISKTDGLASNDLVYGFYINPENSLFVGNEKTFEKVDLNKILKTELIDQLKLTTIKVDNEFLPHISEDISLKEKEANQIDYYFSALNYSGKEKLVYRYKFDDEEWHYLGSVPKLSLIKLSPGKYIITIEVGDNLGNWQKKNLVLNLKIIPPFHKTIWFFLLILLGFLGIAFGVNRYMVYQEKQKGILKKKVKENENKMLRSQMNPHFLFNSLNSINSFIIQNKSDEAEKYLTSFSKLMRNILDNSRKESISLKQELETIKLYLDLEAVRMDHKFDYQIKTEKKVDTDLVQIPPLIFQPFLENAIWHGINHKDGKGFIEMEIRLDKQNENQLIITIKDDGIGRKATSKMKKSGNNHKSHGLDITKERLVMDSPENSVEITDLYDEENQPTGTLVTLKIKMDHD